MTGKVKYAPRSWRDYNKSLIQRGSLCLWVNDEVFEQWEAPSETRRGAPRKYSDVAINTILKVKFLFNLTLRAAQGLF
ncbi:MAG TPA: transposase, partial [Candidatus Berkiella sp.]|nr:transposase [Candidatus Berkiella sp.]